MNLNLLRNPRICIATRPSSILLPMILSVPGEDACPSPSVTAKNCLTTTLFFLMPWVTAQLKRRRLFCKASSKPHWDKNPQFIRFWKSKFPQEFTFQKSQFSQKITFCQSRFIQNLHFETIIFDKIHNFKISVLTKFTFSKSHLSQNSQFYTLIFHKVHNFKISSFTMLTFF